VTRCVIEVSAHTGSWIRSRSKNTGLGLDTIHEECDEDGRVFERLNRVWLSAGQVHHGACAHRLRSAVRNDLALAPKALN